jgi:hypothetical protein
MPASIAGANQPRKEIKIETDPLPPGEHRFRKMDWIWSVEQKFGFSPGDDPAC